VTLLLGMGLLGGIATNVAFNSWLPTYYNEEFGYSLQRAGIVVGVLSVFGIVGALLGSALPFRTGVRRPFIVGSGVLMPIAALGCFAIDSPLVLYPAAALFGIGAWLYFPVAFTIPLEIPGLRPEAAAAMVSTALSIGNLSGFLAPLMVGLVRDLTGDFRIGLGICALLPLGLILAGLLLPETGPGRARARPVIVAAAAVAEPEP
jgi:ACS family tartrate transporter-like MFS transporter